ncbi:MAG: hypothetical protein AAF629_26130, partial [Chloroflexota bacterium]
NIAANFLLQYTSPVNSIRFGENIKKTPNQILQQISAALQSGGSDLVNLGVIQPGKGGHSILPYAIEDMGNGVYHVKAYDNNDPNDESRYVEFDTSANTWQYDMKGHGVWAGTATSQTMTALPLSTFLQQPDCPWCASAARSSGIDGISPSNRYQTLLNGEGRLLISDSNGNRIGHLNGQPINEIPEAFGVSPMTGLGVDAEPVYNIPNSGPLDISVTGLSPTPSKVSVNQFGPNWAVGVDKLSVTDSISGDLKIPADGSTLSLSSKADQNVTLTLAIDDTDSWRFSAQGVNVGANKLVSLKHDKSTNSLSVVREEADNDTYDLSIQRVNGSGEAVFVRKDIAISSGDTQTIDLSTWGSSNTLEICTDAGSNGSVEGCETVENEASDDNAVYFPIVLRR